MSQLNEIKDGFVNLFRDKIDKLDPEIKRQAEIRFRHCRTCTLRSGNVCNKDATAQHIKTGKLEKGCGCNLAAKTKSPNSVCPIGKWGSMNDWIMIGSSWDEVFYQNKRTGIVAGMKVYDEDGLDENFALDDKEVKRLIYETF